VIEQLQIEVKYAGMCSASGRGTRDGLAKQTPDPADFDYAIDSGLVA
jgi:hypothetical protein